MSIARALIGFFTNMINLSHNFTLYIFSLSGGDESLRSVELRKDIRINFLSDAFYLFIIFYIFFIGKIFKI